MGNPIFFWLTTGGGGVWTPSFLADILCEQPLTPINKSQKYWCYYIHTARYLVSPECGIFFEIWVDPLFLKNTFWNFGVN